ncbi:protein CYPRO4-like [Pyrus ussuriensis x Pyrus communis]|uniref:Protein CYPRO4-like n=1 Tax=Pyrus ussuriensis x Pyrus communis TaxID=2448454 RepID=A0A5N5FIC4_9ROSA|nr:protein CYPRO4-like [Pyrus ussuriensis x Pyrus communis]
MRITSSTPTITTASTAQGPNAVKLYLHVGGNTPKAKWIVSKKTAYSFVKISNVEDDLDYDNDEKMDREGEWFLKVKPEAINDSAWDYKDYKKSPNSATLGRPGHDLMEEFEEATNGGVQSLTLGTLDNSYLVNESGVQEGRPQSNGLQQLDIEMGKIVSEWKFQKDGTYITMRDIIYDTKGSELDLSESTFLGLDDNMLCKWDMYDHAGMVQNIANVNSPIRLYSKTSMRQAKTAFPGLDPPITLNDVTYDGKLVLGTTDTYLVLICTLFTDKDGNTKIEFSSWAGNKILAPRLLKLTPLDSHLAGTDNNLSWEQMPLGSQESPWWYLRGYPLEQNLSHSSYNVKDISNGLRRSWANVGPIIFGTTMATHTKISRSLIGLSFAFILEDE